MSSTHDSDWSKVSPPFDVTDAKLLTSAVRLSNVTRFVRNIIKKTNKTVIFVMINKQIKHKWSDVFLLQAEIICLAV